MATALVPLAPAAPGVLPHWQEGLWVSAAPGNHTWLAVSPLWVRMALSPQGHGDLAVSGSGTSHLSCGTCPAPEPRADTGAIPASLRDYTVFTANRCRKTGPETAQQQLAANERSKIIYWTLVVQSLIAALGQLQQPRATKPLHQRNQSVVADGHSCRAGGDSEGLTGKAPGDAQG